MKYSQAKEVKEFCNNLFSKPSWRDVIEEATSASAVDFEVENVRFILASSIDSIQQEELESDLYVLGCFNADFLAPILDIDIEAIQEMQKAEAYTAIGTLIVKMGKLEEVQEGYASADGYGHHFNRYDFGEDEISINGSNYLVFDNH